MCPYLQLSEAFTLYKKEKTENDRMLNETNDKLQKQLAELHSNRAKLSSQLEFSNKRSVRLQLPPFVVHIISFNCMLYVCQV